MLRLNQVALNTDSLIYDLKYFLSPRSIAVIGASENFASISGKPLHLLIEHD